MMSHVTRDERERIADKCVPAQQLEWGEVLMCMIAELMEDKIKINLVETVLLDKQSVLHYVSTDVEGYMRAKIKSQQSIEDIQKEILAIILWMQRDTGSNMAISYNHGSSSPTVIDTRVFADLYCSCSEESFPSKLQILQFCTASKGSKTQSCTHRTVFAVENSDLQTKNDRLTLISLVSDPPGIFSNTNVKSRIKKDSNGKIWLQNSSNCKVILLREDANRAASPVELKLARTAQMADTQGATMAERVKVDDNIPSMIGRNKSSRRKGGLSSTSPLRGDRASVPDARLGDEVHVLASNTALLGSTQLSGLCQGDYCSFQLTGPECIEILTDSRISKGMLDLSTSVIQTNKSKLSAAGGINSIAVPFSKVKLIRRMSLGSVIRAREEKFHVDRLLQRYMTGEVGEYMDIGAQWDRAVDVDVSGMLPSHYYKEISVCETCFLVYRIIDTARQRSIRKITFNKRVRSSTALITATSSPPSFSSALPSSSSTSPTFDRQIDHRPITPTARRLVSTAENGDTQNISLDGEFTQRNAEAVDSSQSESENGLAAAFKLSHKSLSYLLSMKAIESLTKLDVAEIRTLQNPPVAVIVVLEAVVVLLTGKVMSFQDIRRLLNGGDAFLLMLQQFCLDDITDARLLLAETYVDNPMFRPVNVEPISVCAAKFCCWVLGAVQAARWQRGLGHNRTDVISASSSAGRVQGVREATKITSHHPEKASIEKKRRQLLFHREAAIIRSSSLSNVNSPRTRSRYSQGDGNNSSHIKATSAPSSSHLYQMNSISTLSTSSLSGIFDGISPPTLPLPVSVQSPRPIRGRDRNRRNEEIKTRGGRKNREFSPQKQNATRLSSHDKGARAGTGGVCRNFKCDDGVTVMPYIVLGEPSDRVLRCNFVVVHDFFDTADATSLLFKPIILHHGNCQALCFNYPGQANTVWSRLPAAERARGTLVQSHNNDWIADRLHELLQHVETTKSYLLSNPFHLVGLGNGGCIAAAFAQRWGAHPSYSHSIRSIVAINGFLFPDPQLTAVLHSAVEIFENTIPSRPDIPVSLWSRYIFSEQYLDLVSLNLALNIHTAVSNPITNEGRCKIARGAMQHRDLRGGLAPDLLQRRVIANNALSHTKGGLQTLFPVQVPLVLLQSTEDNLIDASNADPYLVGRSTRHLWSHQLNIPSGTHTQPPGSGLHYNSDVNQWAGRLSRGPDDYQECSTLGRHGLKILLEVLADPRGAFVMWTRTGHAVQQENKPALLDLLDALAYPSENYVGYLSDQSISPEIYTSPDDRLRSSAATVTVLLLAENFLDYQPYQTTHSNFHELCTSINLIKLPPRTSIKVGEATDISVMSSIIAVDDEDVESITSKIEIMFSLNRMSKQVAQPDRDATDVASIEELDPKELSLETGAIYGEEDKLSPKAIPDSNSIATIESSPLLFSSSKSPSFSKRVSILVCVSDSDSESDVDIGINSTENVVVPSLLFPDIPIAAIRNIPVTPKSLSESDIASSLYSSPQSTSLKSMRLAEIASKQQRERREWVALVPSATEEFRREAELRAQQKNYADLELQIRDRRAQEAHSRLLRLEEEQRVRKKQYEDEDKMLLGKLEAELETRRLLREAGDRQRRLQLQALDTMLVEGGVLDGRHELTIEREPVREMIPLIYSLQTRDPLGMEGDIPSQLDELVAQQALSLKRSNGMTMEDFKFDTQPTLKLTVELVSRNEISVQQKMREEERSANRIQRAHRDFMERKHSTLAEKLLKLNLGVSKLQAAARGSHCRMLIVQHRVSAVSIQSIYRGYRSRKSTKKLRLYVSATFLQGWLRYYTYRRKVNREKARLDLIIRQHQCATRIQSIWHMKVAKDVVHSLQIHILAAMEIQRCFRGSMGRRQMRRRRKWEAAVPGPERIQLGLQMIEESKAVFERQQVEIDMLHRAQERAEARVSHIYTELKDSEEELMILERELLEIDQIENDLVTLNRERDVLVSGSFQRVSNGGRDIDSDIVIAKEREAETYALEITIQNKRLERERKRQELETEFAAVFLEVGKKKKALDKLELNLADMESTRERKDREFRRLQANLMQLLSEQKTELDDLRGKGIELETATAMTAAAATATALKAKEHEKRSTVMFSQTEELMKFQFMSMSLSYFSSLNMLKQLRDMNSDTTSSAITASADAAASAAAAAAAANLPNIRRLDLGAGEFVDQSIIRKKNELEASSKAERDMEFIRINPLPDKAYNWSVNDVCRWLDVLSLGQYAAAFKEASVDGPFLMELREEDMVQVLGINHRLHVRKILVSIEKLRPHSQKEEKERGSALSEALADNSREEIQAVPDITIVFSQCRNGRIKKVEESLNLGFSIDGEDEKGNTLLLVACQNSNKRMVEMLLLRGASVNHQNGQGNSALHFALAFDTEGMLGEYLIEHGADDTLENIEGLTPYDGVV